MLRENKNQLPCTGGGVGCEEEKGLWAQVGGVSEAEVAEVLVMGEGGWGEDQSPHSPRLCKVRDHR